MSGETLEACPWCPESIVDVVENDYPSSGWWQVWCGACGTSSGRYKKRCEAVTHWNRRAPHPAEAKLAEAEERIATLQHDHHVGECESCKVVEAKLARYEKALRFYAEPRAGFAMEYWQDGGSTARTALAATEDERDGRAET